MKVAILHPWLLGMGGGERVAEIVAEIYPDADIFTLFANRDLPFESLRNRKITTSFLNKLPFAAKLHYQYIPLYPWAVESLDLRGYDLLLSMCAPVLMGANAQQDALHLCYCHTPPRPWWDLYAANQRRGNRFTQPVFLGASTFLRTWEFNAVQRIDRMVSNSSYIARRVAQYYRKESGVIYPPVDTHKGYISTKIDDYYLTVGRLAQQKRVELLIEACNRLGRNLVVVGTGREEARLKALAGPTVRVMGFVEEAELQSLYARCRAFLFAADEDFGIAPVEAQSYGRPVVAYGHGGSLETVRVGDETGKPDTGVHFAQQTAESVIEAIQHFETIETRFVPEEIQAHARQFDTSIFKVRFQQFVDESVQQLTRAGRGGRRELVPDRILRTSPQ